MKEKLGLMSQHVYIHWYCRYIHVFLYTLVLQVYTCISVAYSDEELSLREGAEMEEVFCVEQRQREGI